MREAARRQSAYVIVPDDPLAEVAASWRAMWDVASGPGGAAAFEEQRRGGTGRVAGQAVRAARLLPGGGRHAQAEGIGPDLYLGPLRGPGRAGWRSRLASESPGQAGPAARCAASLEHGPWWPPLDELIEAARRFYAGGLAETQAAPAAG